MEKVYCVHLLILTYVAIEKTKKKREKDACNIKHHTLIATFYSNYIFMHKKNYFTKMSQNLVTNLKIILLELDHRQNNSVSYSN